VSSDPTAVALPDALERVVETAPLVAAVTNKVTIAEVAQVIDNWGGLPVMSEDDREIDEFVAAAQAVLLNVGTVTESQEVTMVDAADAAAELDVPVVLDPVGVGATGTRDRVAAALFQILNNSLFKLRR
jgi:hydroxyethylthiazole kinase